MNISALTQKFIFGSGIVYILVRDLIVIIVLGVFLHYFIFSVYPVLGASMEPGLKANYLVLINKITKHKDIKRGQVIILKFPADKESRLLVKRVIGLPGEKISISKDQIKINGVVLEENYLGSKENYQIGMETDFSIEKNLGQDEYYVMGDNRLNSTDSRAFGQIQTEDILGKAQFILWPFNHFEALTLPNY